MIILGSDHAGDELKQHIMAHLDELGIAYKDLGFYELRRDDDYPVIAKKVAKAVQNGEGEFGMLVCGTGIGMSMCANKYSGIRAVVASDMFSVRHSRLHNNANILCFGARVMARGLAADLCDLFLNTSFEGGRHATRVAMFEEDLT